MYDTLIRFCYYVVEQTAIPNNNLMKLLTEIDLYTHDSGRYGDIPDDKKLLSDIYGKLAGEYCKSDWKKYMKLELKDSLIQQFTNKK